MSRDTGVLIAMTEAKSSVNIEDSLQDRLRAAMKRTHRHWMVTDPDEQLRAAVGAVLLSASEDEKERIEVELNALRSMSAMLSGVPVDIERIPVLEEPIGIMKLWHEIEGVAG